MTSVAEAFVTLRPDRKVFESETDGMFSKFGGAAKLAFAAAGAAAAGALAKGLADAMNMDAANDKLAAQLGLSTDESKKAGKIAGDLYAGAWGDSLGHVNEALGAVSSTLGSVAVTGEEDLSRWTAQALDLSAAFDVDVARAVSSAGTLLTTGLAKDADEAFDLITVGMQNMPAHLREELLEASDEYGTFFAGLGIQGEEAFGLLVQAAEGGVYGIDKTGDALKELTIRATDMSVTSVDAFKKAGFNAEEMATRFLAGGDQAREALTELVWGLQDIKDPVEQATAAVGLFGTPLEDLGTSEIPGFLESLDLMNNGMGGVAGAAEAMGDTLNDNAKTKIESFKRQGLMALTNFVAEKVLPMFDSIGEWWATNGPVIVGYGNTLRDGLVRAFGIVRDAGTLVVEHLGGLRDTFRSAFETIQVIVERVIEILTLAWDRFGRGLVDNIAAAFEAVGTILGGALQILGGIFDLISAVLTGKWGAAWDALKQIVGGAWEVIKGIIGLQLAAIRIAIETVLGAISMIWSGAWNGLKTFVSDIWEGIKSTVSAAAQWVRDKIDTVMKPLQRAVDLVNKLPGTGGSILNESQRRAIQQRAVGGPVSAFSPYIVGEQGPELFVPNASGSIVPNHNLGDGQGAVVAAVEALRAEVRRMSDRQVRLARTGG